MLNIILSGFILLKNCALLPFLLSSKSNNYLVNFINSDISLYIYIYTLRMKACAVLVNILPYYR